MGQIRIQVATLADVGDDESRTDGVSGQQVTLTSIDTAATHLMQLVSSTEDPAPVLTQLTPTVWTFTPNNGAQTYVIQCTTVTSGGVTDITRRIYAIRTTATGLAFPGYNEKANPAASLFNNDADIIAASENNEDGNYFGWGPTLHGWLEAIEELRVDVDVLAGPAAVSLDDAYNEDRIITVDAGAVALQANNAAAAALLEITNAGTGDAAVAYEANGSTFAAGTQGSSGEYQVRPGAELTGDGLSVQADGTVAATANLSVGGEVSSVGATTRRVHLETTAAEDVLIELDANGAQFVIGVDATTGNLEIKTGLNPAAGAGVTITAAGVVSVSSAASLGSASVQLGSAGTNPPFAWLGTGAWTMSGSTGVAGQSLRSLGGSAAPAWQYASVLDSASATLAVTTEEYILCAGTDTTAQTVELPAGSVGRVIMIKDKAGQASINAITIVPDGAETIDGSASISLTSNYESVSLIFSGTNWSIF